jgi:two-component system phosphate regulon sensor histidine kinase PhoR
MKSAIRRELLNLSIAGIIVLVLGLVTGLMVELFILAMLGYIAWNLYNLSLMVRWLNKPSKNLPESAGMWDEVYYQLYHLYRRQRKAKKKLSSIVMRFQESTQAMPFAAIVLNSNHEIKWFNRAASSLFNLYQSPDVGVPIINLIRDPGFSEYLSKQKFDDSFEFVFNQRQVILNVTKYGSGQYLLSARDVTQQRLIDDMRRDFIANASHELRTPITVISGYAEALLSSADDSGRVPLENILQQTERMQKIIEDLIVLAKLESREKTVELETVNLADLLGEIYNDAKVIDDNRHELILSAEPIVIEGHRDELRMAISNLITNAIRYTPDGGTIRLYSTTNNGFAIAGVEDTGIGIMPEHLPRLTERFYRVDAGRSREKGGTGLGLAIVKHILDHHNANLYIDSIPGEGTDFRCEFARSSSVT